MTGLALEGGADRSAFTAGVLDTLMERGFYASAASGTSAGAGCVLNYRSGQSGIAKQILSMQKERRYFGIRQLARSGSFLDLECIAAEFASRMDFQTYFQPSMQTDYVATCCEDGTPAYLTDFGDKRRLFTAFMASCALPVICKPVELDGKHYIDGSIADPIPFSHLLEKGCNKVLVVLTGSAGCHPTDYSKWKLLLRRLYRKQYPALYTALVHRISRYQAEVRRLEQEQKNGRVFVLRPQITPIPLFTHDSKKIEQYYQHGKVLTERTWREFSDWLEKEPPIPSDDPINTAFPQMECVF